MQIFTNSQNSSKQQSLGFTLIELLVVISIIGVLAALLISNLVSARERGNDAKVKSEMNSLKTALRLYYNDYQSYPASKEPLGLIVGCGNGATATDCSSGGTFSRLSTTYMQKLPSSSPTVIYKSDGSDKFVMTAALKNTSDPAIAESSTRCSTICADIDALADATCSIGTKYAVCSD